MACQICLEDFSTATNSSNMRIQRLCHEPTCTADMCKGCLNHHIQTALDDCATGALPRVRCPICLAPLSTSKWAAHMAFTALEEQYVKCARVALTFEAPCCSTPDYTHLPDSSASFPIGHEQCEIDSPHLKDPADKATLMNLLCAFNKHEIQAPEVVQFLVGQCERSRDAEIFLMEVVLPRFSDEERRASLLLAHLYQYPVAYTHCCTDFVCFLCKRQHMGDEPCDDEAGFSMTDCVVRCRQCRVMLVKTEGCDAVRCPCGFNMLWSNELRYRSLHKRLLLPVDLFDRERMSVFERGNRIFTMDILPTHRTTT